MDGLLRDLRARLLAVADAERAPAMQAYMKSSMPYHGVPAPRVRATCRALFADVPLASAQAWQAQVRALWHGATHREERYGAIALSQHRRARAFVTVEALPLFEELIVTGAWWDYVNDVAHHSVGELLGREPASMTKVMRAWSHSDDMWKRRTAIICQNGFRMETDLDLLYACIEPALASKEFFLRKAIGWALREYAKTDPDEVLRYVRAHKDELSGLSKREALKAALRDGTLDGVP